MLKDVKFQVIDNTKKIKFFSLVALFIVFLLVLIWHFNQKNRCWNDIDFKKTEQLLLTSAIEQKIPLKIYPPSEEKSDVFLLFFKNGLRAVFKPDRPVLEQASALRAYHLSQLMNFKLVPPTVIRTIDGKKGTLQFFVEGVMGYDYDLSNLSFFYKRNIYIFNFILGGFDSDPDDIVIGKNCNYPALIDNDGNMVLVSFIQYGDFPWVRFPIINAENLEESIDIAEYKNFPFDKIEVMKKVFSVAPEKIKRIFAHVTSYGFINLFEPFLPNDLVNDTLYYVKWENSIWVKFNLQELKYIYKDFAPHFLSKKTIKELQTLDIDQLHSLYSVIETWFNEKEKSEILNRLKVMNNLSIYKRDILLKEFKKIMSTP